MEKEYISHRMHIRNAVIIYIIKYIYSYNSSLLVALQNLSGR